MFNSSFNVYKTEWLDLVFNNRNKNYGAYVLRTESSSILVRSLIVSGAVLLLLCVSPLVYSKFFPEEIVADSDSRIIDLPTQISDFKKNEEKKKIELSKAQSSAAKLKTVNNSSNIVVVEETIMKPPTIDETKGAVISNHTQEGDVNPNATASGTADNGSGLMGDQGNGDKGSDEGTANGDPMAIVDSFGVDEFPSFLGGEKAFAKYIQRNLRYPDAAQEAGTMGKVFISFVIEKDGSVSNVNLVKGIGFGCDEEAVRVIKRSPLWKPGKNRGMAVRVRYNVPINFTMTN